MFFFNKKNVAAGKAAAEASKKEKVANSNELRTTNDAADMQVPEVETNNIMEESVSRQEEKNELEGSNNKTYVRDVVDL